MPLYEYQCSNCKERIELIQKVSDPPPARCPSCGGEMKKMHSAPAIQFRGSGFYKTDYPSPGSRPTTESKSESKSETKSEAKSETKPEAKGDSKSD